MQKVGELYQCIGKLLSYLVGTLETPKVDRQDAICYNFNSNCRPIKLTIKISVNIIKKKIGTFLFYLVSNLWGFKIVGQHFNDNC